MCKIVRLDTLFIIESLLSRFISSPRLLSGFVSFSTFLTFFRKFLLLSVSFLLLEHFSRFFFPSILSPCAFPSQHLFSLPTFFLISLRSSSPTFLFRSFHSSRDCFTFIPYISGISLTFFRLTFRSSEKRTTSHAIQ